MKNIQILKSDYPLLSSEEIDALVNFAAELYGDGDVENVRRIITVGAKRDENSSNEKIKQRAILKHDIVKQYAEIEGEKLEKGGATDRNKVTAKVLVISSSHPLATQIQNLTGDSSWEDLEDPKSGDPYVIKAKNGEIFIVFTLNYIAQVPQSAIEDNLSYVKKTYGVDEVEWVRKPKDIKKYEKFEEGGKVKDLPILSKSEILERIEKTDIQHNTVFFYSNGIPIDGFTVLPYHDKKTADEQKEKHIKDAFKKAEIENRIINQIKIVPDNFEKGGNVDKKSEDLSVKLTTFEITAPKEKEADLKTFMKMRDVENYKRKEEGERVTYSFNMSDIGMADQFKGMSMKYGFEFKEGGSVDTNKHYEFKVSFHINNPSDYAVSARRFGEDIKGHKGGEQFDFTIDNFNVVEGDSVANYTLEGDFYYNGELNKDELTDEIAEIIGSYVESFTSKYPQDFQATLSIVGENKKEEGGSVSKPSTIIPYDDIITHTKGEIDITKSREEFAKEMAENYAKQSGKKVTRKTIDYFEKDPSAFWDVRNILEDIKTENFNDVVRVFKELYPKASEGVYGWQSALKTGLVVKAKDTEGNYAGKPFIYNDALAVRIREAGINFLQPIIDEIMNGYFAEGGDLTSAWGYGYFLWNKTDKEVIGLHFHTKAAADGSILAYDKKHNTALSDVMIFGSQEDFNAKKAEYASKPPVDDKLSEMGLVIFDKDEDSGSVTFVYQKGDIEFEGVITAYNTGRTFDHKVSVDFFADQASEDFWDENWEDLEEKILAQYDSESKEKGGKLYTYPKSVVYDSNNKKIERQDFTEFDGTLLYSCYFEDKLLFTTTSTKIANRFAIMPRDLFDMYYSTELGNEAKRISASLSESSYTTNQSDSKKRDEKMDAYFQKKLRELVDKKSESYPSLTENKSRLRYISELVTYEATNRTVEYTVEDLYDWAEKYAKEHFHNYKEGDEDNFKVGGAIDYVYAKLTAEKGCDMFIDIFKNMNNEYRLGFPSFSVDKLKDFLKPDDVLLINTEHGESKYYYTEVVDGKLHVSNSYGIHQFDLSSFEDYEIREINHNVVGLYIDIQKYFSDVDRYVCVKKGEERFFLEPDAFMKYENGGHIGFEALSKRVASEYEGQPVPEKYQELYGKRYSKAAAAEVGDKVAAKVARIKGFKEGGNITDYKKGDLVFVKNEGGHGLVGLIVSDKHLDEDKDEVYDVYYRGYMGDVVPTPPEDFEDITEGHIDYAIENGDLLHYPNIAKRLRIEINPKYQDAISEEIEEGEEEFAKGGSVATTGDTVTLVKGYGYWDLSKYPYGGDFKRFTGEESAALIKGTIKIGGQIRAKLSDGREIITDMRAIVAPDFEAKDAIYEKNKHLWIFGYAKGGSVSEVQYLEIPDIAERLSKGLPFKERGWEIANSYPVKSEAKEHAEKIIGKGFEVIVVKGSHDYYVFTKNKVHFQKEKGGSVSDRLSNVIIILEFSQYGDTKRVEVRTDKGVAYAKQMVHGGYGIPIKDIKLISESVVESYLPIGISDAVEPMAKGGNAGKKKGKSK